MKDIFTDSNDSELFDVGNQSISYWEPEMKYIWEFACLCWWRLTASWLVEMKVMAVRLWSSWRSCSRVWTETLLWARRGHSPHSPLAWHQLSQKNAPRYWRQSGGRKLLQLEFSTKWSMKMRQRLVVPGWWVSTLLCSVDPFNKLLDLEILPGKAWSNIERYEERIERLRKNENDQLWAT